MRKLAAIMFTDIEGFTSLMQNDEAGALQLLEKHKQLFLECVRQNDGRVIKYLGDGTLTIFNSSLQAVKCAIALQQKFLQNPEIRVRIGIHQGEVVLENKDVLGDAVNVASRIQNAGTPGSVLVSERIHAELQNHPEIKTTYLGLKKLKNVRQPLPLYGVISHGLTVPDSFPPDDTTGSEALISHKKSIPGSTRKKWISGLLIGLIIFSVSGGLWYFTSQKTNIKRYKSLAVMPFSNIGQHESYNFLAEGLTEEIISLLSLNPVLRIRKVSYTLSGESNEAGLLQVLKGLKTEAILEGKIQAFNDSFRIFVSLRNILNNEIIWAETFNKSFREQLSFQQELAKQIAGELNAEYSGANIARFETGKTTNPDAYTYYIQGRYAQNKRSTESMREAIFLFGKAIQEDSAFVQAWSGISDNYTILIDNGRIPYDSGIHQASAAMQKAFKLDSSLAEVRASRGIYLSSLYNNRKEALKELKKAIEIKPNYAAAHQWYAVELAAEGQFDSALYHIDYALDLDPFSERILHLKNMILVYAGKYKDALALLNANSGRFRINTSDISLRTESFFQLGQMDSVKYYARSIPPGFKDSAFWYAVISGNTADLERQLKDMDVKSDEISATYYVYMERPEKALDFLENALIHKEYSWLKFLKVNPDWKPLHNQNRYRELLSKLGFETQ